MKFNLDCYFGGSKIPRSFTMSEEDRVRFVDFYFEGNYTRSHGMRMPNKKIKQELQHIRTIQRQPGVTTPDITTTPSLRFNVIKCNHTSIEQLCEEYRDIAFSLKCDDMNEDNLIECIDAKSDIGYASLCHQGIPFVVYITRPQLHHRDDDSSEEEEEEEEENEKDDKRSRPIKRIVNTKTKRKRVEEEDEEDYDNDNTMGYNQYIETEDNDNSSDSDDNSNDDNEK